MFKLVKMKTGEILVTDLYHTDNLLEFIQNTEDYDLLLENEIFPECDLLMIQPATIYTTETKKEIRTHLEKSTPYAMDFIVPIRSSDVIYITNPDTFITKLYGCFIDKVRQEENLSTARTKILQKTLDQLTPEEIETLFDSVDTNIKN